MNLTSAVSDFLIMTGRERPIRPLRRTPPALKMASLQTGPYWYGSYAFDLAFAVSKTEEFGKPTSPVEYRYKLRHRRKPDVGVSATSIDIRRRRTG